MKKANYYLDDKLIHKINKINILIEKSNCRQLELIDSQNLSRLSKENKSSDFSQKFILNLWHLGFLNADIVYSDKKLHIDGLFLIEKRGERFLYADERKITVKATEYSNVISRLEDIYHDVIPLFHPFRCYVLYHIYNRLKLKFSSEKTLLNAKDFDQLISLQIGSFNYWLTKEGMILLKYWNHITSIAVISEPSVHRIIFNKVTCDNSDSYKSVIDRLKKIREEMTNLFQTIGEEIIEYYRDEICTNAEIIDSNKNLHLIIRLMKSNERKELKGYISLAVLFLEMAECLRCTLELAFQKNYPEEDKCGFGGAFRDTKSLLQGSTRMLDGDRIVANQFLRRLGLDYGTRIKVYVEGDTEFEALNSEFSANSSVLMINLRGQFKEKHGKGVSFRESLRNDIKSKIFSIIIFDSDVSENYKAVQQAAKSDDICGMFFISKPDFELQNFSIDELTEIAFQFVEKKDLKLSMLGKLKKETKKAKSAREFFTILKKQSLICLSVSKGSKWGEALTKYARWNLLGKEFGDKDDRLINQIIRTIYNGFSASYEVTRQEQKVDPISGKLIERNI
jgi:hypothetical protein